MSQSVLLSIIIVTWNSEADIDSCLKSLTHAIQGLTNEIIVVDNVSKDKTVSIVSKVHPKVILLRQKINWGFGQGNNIALKQTKGKYILLLNPDTKVNPYAIKQMIAFLDKHPKTGVVGPEQFNGSGDTIFITSRLSLIGIIEFTIEKIIRLITGKSIILFPWPHKTYMLNGGCIMARSTLLSNPQWFDPDCFIYGEEHYLFSKVKKKNWDVFFLRSCSIIHYREKSIALTGNKWIFAKNSIVVHLKKTVLGKMISSIFVKNISS